VLPKPAAFVTDRQRLAQAGRSRPALPPLAGGDKARLTRGAATRAPAPLVVTENTWVIRGKDGTYLGFSFGDGRQVGQVNLYDHLPADRVPHLGNYILQLTGIVPDAIGLDIGASAGVSMASGMAGLNIIWHTRGEGGRRWYPEVHVYYGYSASFTIGAIFQSLLAPPNAAAAVQVILAWAKEYDSQGRSKPAASQWVANGFNWTGTFWSVGFSVPVPPRFTFVGSYYQSVPFRDENQQTIIRNQTVWAGVSLGIGVSGKLKVKSPFIKLDLTRILDFKKLNLALNQSQTEYGLIYGNGRDYIPQRGNRDISGWHLPVNQNDYPPQ
jgi:hypothetical protein